MGVVKLVTAVDRGWNEVQFNWRATNLPQPPLWIPAFAGMTGVLQRSCYYVVSWLPIGRKAGFGLADQPVRWSYFWLMWGRTWV